PRQAQRRPARERRPGAAARRVPGDRRHRPPQHTAIVTARLQRIRDERGIALIVALGMLLVMSILVAGMVSYSSATGRSARYSKDQQVARSIAEAGLNDAVAVLNLPS